VSEPWRRDAGFPSPGEMRAAVEEAARAQLADQGRLLAVTPVHSGGRAYSAVHRMELRFEKRTLDVCLKLYRPHDRIHEGQCVRWARKEFSVLGALHPGTLGAEELSVVKPLALLPELPGILLETDHGTVLNTVLKARRFGVRRQRSIEALERCYRNLGVSLRELHDLTVENLAVAKALAGLSLRTASADDLVKEADEEFQGAMLLSTNGGWAVTERRYRLARENFCRLADAGPHRVGVHGDFTPVNVFVHDARATLFDFLTFHVGHPYEDVGRLLSYTYFEQKDPLSLRRRDVTRLIVAFMDGYGVPEWRGDPALEFFFQKGMFRTLRGGFRFAKRPGLARLIYRRAMLRVFHQWMKEGMALPS
jgi:hypothetical protein